MKILHAAFASFVHSESAMFTLLTGLTMITIIMVLLYKAYEGCLKPFFAWLSSALLIWFTIVFVIHFKISFEPNHVRVSTAKAPYHLLEPRGE